MKYQHEWLYLQKQYLHMLIADLAKMISFGDAVVGIPRFYILIISYRVECHARTRCICSSCL